MGLFAIFRSVFLPIDKLIRFINFSLSLLSLSDETSIYQAASNNCADTVELLLEDGADPTLAKNNGFTPLMIAAREGHIKVVKVLLASKYHEEIINQQIDDCYGGATALCQAASNNHADIVELLLENGADPSRAGHNSFIPLTIAAREGHIKVVKVLMAPEYRAGFDGPEALYQAASNNRADIVDLLLENDAYLMLATCNVFSSLGFRLLTIATREGHIKVVEVLLESGYRAGLDVPIALCQAALNNLEDIVKLLLENGADPTLAARYSGDTPLMIAARKGHIKVVKALLESEYREEIINQVNNKNSNKTALHIASEKGHIEILELFFEFGVNDSLLTNLSETALQLAEQKSHNECAEFLREESLIADTMACEDLSEFIEQVMPDGATKHSDDSARRFEEYKKAVESNKAVALNAPANAEPHSKCTINDGRTILTLYEKTTFQDMPISALVTAQERISKCKGRYTALYDRCPADVVSVIMEYDATTYGSNAATEYAKAARSRICAQ